MLYIPPLVLPYAPSFTCLGDETPDPRPPSALSTESRSSSRGSDPDITTCYYPIEDSFHRYNCLYIKLDMYMARTGLSIITLIFLGGPLAFPNQIRSSEVPVKKSKNQTLKRFSDMASGKLLELEIGKKGVIERREMERFEIVWESGESSFFSFNSFGELKGTKPGFALYVP